MLLEPTATGASIDLDRVPRPAGVPLADWVSAFPSYAFLLCALPRHVQDCADAFRDEGLACERVGTLDGSASLRVRVDGRERTLLDLREATVTGLQGLAEG
jgi:selenophosphate synthetase-related protein